MKPFKLVILIVVLSTVNGFAIDTPSKSFSKSQKKEIVPPGTVLFEEGLYVDKTEISNFSWLEYVYWMKSHFGDSSKQYINALPDTMVWGSESPYASHYYHHPSYQNFPVVGISYEQAVAYCTWRSDRVNEMLFAKKNKVVYHFYKEDSSFAEIPEVCNYRLPNEVEWETFSTEPFSKKNTRKYKKYGAKMNVKREHDEAGIDKDGSDVTAPVDCYWPNIYGIYNLLGNVSEMVAEKGKSKGGSWFHKVEECTVDSVIEYSVASSWLGFRCVCEVNQ
ncbi:MAG: SUMF1/EgtB/PvdO family nonheme iron enzyme [Crocinitomix sp.]|nr:SUMF1/EgtB/PvdO family nonheme iron enzyme [Crocinitomix sp.]